MSSTTYAPSRDLPRPTPRGPAMAASLVRLSLLLALFLPAAALASGGDDPAPPKAHSTPDATAAPDIQRAGATGATTAPRLAPQSLVRGAGLSPATASLRPAPAPVTWRDLDRNRRAWPSRDRLAEIPATHEGEAAVRARFPDARPHDARLGGARVWTLPAGTSPTQAAAALAGATTASRFAPIFHDAPAPRSRMRAPNGTVIVRFDARLADDALASWAKARELDIVHVLPLRAPTVAFRATTGTDTLALADTLAGADGVAGASPGWWVQLSRR